MKFILEEWCMKDKEREWAYQILLWFKKTTLSLTIIIPKLRIHTKIQLPHKIVHHLVTIISIPTLINKRQRTQDLVMFICLLQAQELKESEKLPMFPQNSTYAPQALLALTFSQTTSVEFQNLFMDNWATLKSKNMLDLCRAF